MRLHLWLACARPPAAHSWVRHAELVGGIVQHRAVFLRFNRIDLEAGPRWPDAGIRPVACPTEVLQRRWRGQTGQNLRKFRQAS